MEAARFKSPRLPYVLLWTVLGGVLIGIGVLFARFADGLPVESTSLAIDWAGLWHDIRVGIHYQGTLRNPPWSVLILWPVIQLGMKQAWGLVIYATLIIEVLSVPPARRTWLTVLGILLLTTSFPSLRNMADGNLEGLVIAGVLLISTGMNRQQPVLLATGILLASAKPQSVVLLMPVLGLTLLITMPRRKLIQTAALVLLIVFPTLIWRGAEWWREGIQGNIHANSLVDISLRATLDRLGTGSVVTGLVIIAVIGMSGTVYWLTKPTLSRETIGMLIAASLLVSPYSAGNSILTVIAIGIMPLFQTNPISGLMIFALVNASWWLHIQEQQAAFSNYSTLLLIILFLLLARAHFRVTPVQQTERADTSN